MTDDDTAQRIDFIMEKREFVRYSFLTLIRYASSLYPWSYLARLLHNSLKATVRLRATLLHVHVHPPHMCEEWTCTTYMSIPHTKSICHVHCTWQMLFRASQPKEARDRLCLFCCSFKKEIKIQIQIQIQRLFYFLFSFKPWVAGPAINQRLFYF